MWRSGFQAWVHEAVSFMIILSSNQYSQFEAVAYENIFSGAFLAR